MRCVFCNYIESRVLDSRPNDDGTEIRRRRKCDNCGRRFTTYEKPETQPLMVIKKDKRREKFNPEKIRAGIEKACEKRPISVKEIQELVNSVESQAYNSGESEISSRKIGEMVMQRIKKMDPVAYIRFASVYRSFNDIESFVGAINAMADNEDERDDEDGDTDRQPE